MKVTNTWSGSLVFNSDTLKGSTWEEYAIIAIDASCKTCGTYPVYVSTQDGVRHCSACGGKLEVGK
jgi:hypothetical protein